MYNSRIRTTQLDNILRRCRPLLFYVIWLGALLSLVSCEFNINHDPECFKCSYKVNGSEKSEEFCDPLITENDKVELRDRMQIAADSLQVALTCKAH